ncbi:MAG: alpha/beta fold hydrolase [Bdellovibrionales bacterium]|nr:alpha/beta fold hydrolase [Bdellovibrionales bacterium]
MKRALSLFRDLLNFLPGSAPTQWEAPRSTNGSVPVFVIVAGFQAQERPLSVIRKRFLKDGFNVVVISMDWLSLSDGIIGLAHMAKRLSGVLLHLRKTTGMRSQVYLVGHSAGGLIARYYVQLLGGSHYCDALVTLGTPHHGTWIALLGFFSHLIVKGRCLFQLLPISPFIRRLNRAAFPSDFPVVSMFSRDDFFCSHDELAAGRVDNVELGRLSHSDFLLSKRAYRELLRRLDIRPINAALSKDALGAKENPPLPA